MRLHCDDGASGTGYSYTIGTGGSSVVALLHDHLAPRLIGRDPAHDRGDLARPVVRHPRHQRRRDHQPGAGRDRHRAVGSGAAAATASRCGAPPAARRQRIPLYTTEGGWLHLIADDAGRRDAGRAEARASAAPRSRSASRMSAEDVARLRAVRDAVGDGFEIMVDANQCFTLERGAAPRAALRASSASPGSRSRCRPTTSPATCGWRRATALPIAVGESLYSIGQFARLPAARRLLDRAGRRGAHRRHHAVAQGGAPGRGLQPRRSARTS